MRLLAAWGSVLLFCTLLTGSALPLVALADDAAPVINIVYPENFSHPTNQDVIFTATVTGGVFVMGLSGLGYSCVLSDADTSAVCTITQNMQGANAFSFQAQSPGGLLTIQVLTITTIDKTAPTTDSVHIESNSATSTSVAHVGDTVSLTFTVNHGNIPDVTIEGVAPDYYNNPFDPRVGTNLFTATHKMLAGDPAGPVTFTIAAPVDPAGNVGEATTTTYDGSSVTFEPDIATPIDTTTESSNVLFLPGIEGSRLYSDGGKLWEPITPESDSLALLYLGIGDARVKSLELDASGKSLRSDIYAKEGDIMDSAVGSDFYKSFVSEMDGLKSAGTISDWKAASYDWRLSLPDIVNNGVQDGNRIYYEEASSTPYIEQTLRDLARRSKTGKVTIIAHSNGGLVAKALMQKLGSAETARLIDKVVLVAVPQSGAPESLGGLLYGYDQGLSSAYNLVSVVSPATARELAQNSPMAYHLLPSQAYFNSVQDAEHSVGKFEGDAYATEHTAYGNFLGSWSELASFASNILGNRTKPAESDLKNAEVANASLLSYAKSEHDSLDSWQPPASTTVYQIAGWGIDTTIAGIDFYSLPQPIGASREYRPVFTEDGDGTVPVPSALMMPAADNVKRYWVNLPKYDRAVHGLFKHGNIFEVSDVRDFIQNILQNDSKDYPEFVTASVPSALDENKRLVFFLHSPLTLGVTDPSGEHTGLNADGTVDEDIPDSSYGQFGEVKYLAVPAGPQYTLALHGQNSGTFSFDMQEQSGGIITASSTIASVPTTLSTLAYLTLSSVADASSLKIDEDSDGTPEITIAPQINAVVSYSPATTTADEVINVPTVEPPASPEGGGSSSGSIATSTRIANTSGPINKVFVPSPAENPTARVEEVLNALSGPSIEALKAGTSTGSTEGVASTTDETQTASAYNAGGANVLNWLESVLYTIWQAFARALQTLFKIF